MIAVRSRLQSGLVIAQIALTQPALLAMGALLIEMSRGFEELPASVHADRIVEVRFNTNPRYGSMDEQREVAIDRVRMQLAALPDIASVVRQEWDADYIDVSGADSTEVRAQSAPPGYFAAMGIPVVRGRDFTTADETGGDTAIIGTDAARRLFGTVDPLGRVIERVGSSGRARSVTIIGVVDEAAAGLVTGRDQPRIYVPDVRLTSHLLVRTRGPADPVIQKIRSAANSAAPDVPVVGVTTHAAIEDGRRAEVTRSVGAAAGAGALALLLTAVGLYAVVAFAVRQRVREIGIRSALGADRRRVVGLFVRRGLRLSAIGLAIGLTLSLIVVRLQALSRGDEPPGGLIGLAAVVALVVVTVAFIASWIPARRAARIDPLEALRMD
jgi:putative ABC transport system permease protein